MKAVANPPIVWLVPTRRPFNLTVTNRNTRQVKVDKVGFETFMRPYGYFEYTCSARLLKTDKLLVTEGDHTEIVFDINAVAQSMGEALSSKTLTYAPQMLKMWLYLTHGSRISVEVDSKIDELLRQAIVSAVATSSKSRTG